MTHIRLESASRFIHYQVRHAACTRHEAQGDGNQRWGGRDCGCCPRSSAAHATCGLRTGLFRQPCQPTGSRCSIPSWCCRTAGWPCSVWSCSCARPLRGICCRSCCRHISRRCCRFWERQASAHLAVCWPAYVSGRLAEHDIAPYRSGRRVPFCPTAHQRGGFRPLPFAAAPAATKCPTVYRKC
jgi:hypothetical protein